MSLAKTSPARIAITINTSWNIYNFRQPLIRSLQSAGYQVVCFAPTDKYVSYLAKENIEVHPITQLRRKGKNPVKDLSLVRELEKAYLAHQISLAIHFTIKPNIYGSVAAHRTGIPSISVVTGLGYTFLSNGLSSRVAKYLYRYAFKKNQLTIFQNPDDRDLFIQQKLVSGERSAVVLGSGIDIDEYKMDTPVPPSPTYLFVGRLLYDKGIRELLDGFLQYSEKYPDARLTVLGDPDPQNPSSITEQELTYYRNQKGIEFIGFQNDVRPYIRNAATVILPSYREGVPRTLLEPLSIGRPLITTDVPGCREVVIPRHNGWMIPPHDSRALASALEEFHITTPERKQEMGRNSRLLAETRFSTHVVNKQYLDWVEKILKSH